jgi:hypothetical protein
MKKAMLLLVAFFFSWTLLAADMGWEKKINGAQTLMDNDKISTFKTALKEPGMKNVRELLFGRAYDDTIPDWIVYIDENDQVYSELLGDDKTIDYRPDKYPYIKDKDYIYVVFITYAGRYDTGNTIIAKVDSLKQQIPTAQQAINFIVSTLISTQVPGTSTAAITNDEKEIKLIAIDSGHTMKFGVKRIQFYMNSENQVRIHFSDKNKVKSVFLKFGARNSQGSRFSVSVAPIVTCENPRNFDAQHMNFNQGEIDLMLHYYPFSDQYPFRNFFELSSINVFIGTPIVGNGAKNAQVINFGVGLSDCFSQNIGIVVGGGVNFGKANKYNLLMGFDFKLI